jgi:hypothetical protein
MFCPDCLIAARSGRGEGFTSVKFERTSPGMRTNPQIFAVALLDAMGAQPTSLAS